MDWRIVAATHSLDGGGFRVLHLTHRCGAHRERNNSVRQRTGLYGAVQSCMPAEAMGALSSDDSQQDNHDGNYQQNVNETAHGVRSY